MNRTVWFVGAIAVALVVVSAVPGRAGEKPLPDGYWSEEQTSKILDKTVTIRLDPDLSRLSEPERQTIDLLLKVGDILNRVYENSRHRQSTDALDKLLALDAKMGHPRSTANLIDLYRMFKGPQGRNLDGNLEAFLPVEATVPGRNVYPWGVTKDEIEAFLAAHPEQRPAILDLRSVVRRSTRGNLKADAARLERSSSAPVLAFLNETAAQDISALAARVKRGKDVPEFYAVPYAVAYADELVEVAELLREAADIIDDTDPEFARFLRHRAIDFLSNDYEAGDASWVLGRFGNLNAQIGAYETYDDQLYGVKAFFGVSVLVKDPVMSESLKTVLHWLQEFEDGLPYDAHKTVRTDIPVGVYNIVADFGQARGTNTATILPNEGYLTRKYGRTILLRRNILEDPELFQVRRNAYEAAVSEAYHDAYDPKGDFFRTMFHEIGHYLGVDQTQDGRSLDIALEEDASILEELKADLVSLHVSKSLNKRGYYPPQRLRSVLASGVRRVLLKTQPRKSQVYATMELMQLNYYLEKGALVFNSDTGQLDVEFGLFHQAVEAMLRDVLSLQYKGDKSAADAFIDKYSAWDENLHGRLAQRMKDAERYRYALVRYGALGE